MDSNASRQLVFSVSKREFGEYDVREFGEYKLLMQTRKKSAVVLKLIS